MLNSRRITKDIFLFKICFHSNLVAALFFFLFLRLKFFDIYICLPPSMGRISKPLKVVLKVAAHSRNRQPIHFRNALAHLHNAVLLNFLPWLMTFGVRLGLKGEDWSPPVATFMPSLHFC